MKKAMKWTGNVLIAIGLALLVILIGGMKSTQDHQSELVEAFATVKTEASTGNGAQAKSFSVQQKEPSSYPKEMEGVLTIPAIEMNAPVLKGASPENLSKALAAINGLDEPGVLNGSYAIAGHQSHVFGQFFNRLNELEIGDVFQYDTPGEMLTFEVFNIEIVKPEEVSVLKPETGIALLSLVTCYPENSNEYRLVVKAKRIHTN